MAVSDCQFIARVFYEHITDKPVVGFFSLKPDPPPSVEGIEV